MAVLDFLIIAVTATIFAMIFVVRTQKLCTGPVSPKTASDQDLGQPGHLLPIEEESKEGDGECSTVASFQSPEFDGKRALEQYYCFPVAYVLAVARVDVELRAV